MMISLGAHYGDWNKGTLYTRLRDLESLHTDLEATVLEPRIVKMVMLVNADYGLNPRIFVTPSNSSYAVPLDGVSTIRSILKTISGIVIVAERRR